VNLEAMRAALADVEDHLEQALEQLGREHEEYLTPQQAASAARCAGCYVELARASLERFAEAARG
jgi:hypothetical protein